MTRPALEANKRPGVCYAITDDGLEVPVIDVTHEAFALAPTPAELASVSAESLRMLKQSMAVPAFLLKTLLKGSILLREAHGDLRFLTGMTTYLQKLGPENLGAAYASETDRKVAASIGPTAMRLRLRDLSGLMAETLATTCRAAPGRAIEMISIGGGPASECWNALLLLRRDDPAAVAGRMIRIRSLDLDTAGPVFGGRCIEALRGDGAPLQGVDVRYFPVVFDWADASTLRDVLGEIGGGALAIGSSEGGLFEYGSDDEIVTNLRVLRDATGADFVMVGSVVRDAATADPSLPIMRDTRGIPPRLMGLGAFGELAQLAGWRIARTIDENPFYHVVGLAKA
jgi:hypothetical protein